MQRASDRKKIPSCHLITRRQALGALTIALPVIGPTSIFPGAIADNLAVSSSESTAALPAKTVYYFTRSGSGSRDGANWSSALPLSALPKSLASAKPGDAYYLGFNPKGDSPIALDKSQVYIRRSGGERSPIYVSAGLISGHDELKSPADESMDTFYASERRWSIDTFSKSRQPPCHFAIAEGASHLRLEGFRVDGTYADGFIKFRAGKKEPATFSHVQLVGIHARNVGRIIETDRGASLTDILIEDCSARGIVRGFARFRNVSRAVLRNLRLDAAGMDAGGKNICQLISVEAGDNILFEDLVLENAINDDIRTSEGKQGYVQGDGVVCERKVDTVTLRNCVCHDMGDAAFDLKATKVTIEDSRTTKCKFGARVWSESENAIRRCEFSEPVSRGSTQGACVQASGTLDVFDTRLQAGTGTTAFHLHKLKNQQPPVIRMHGGKIELNDNATLATANATGILELNDVSVNGTMRSERLDLNANSVR